MNRYVPQFKKTFILGCLALLISGANSEGSCGGSEASEDPPLDSPTPIPTPEPTSCNPEKCATGCCSGNQCMTGATWATCGTKGLDCEVCTKADSCSPAQKCEYVRTAKWRVQPLEASIVPEDPADNSAWDADDSAPDVVVELHCPQLSSSLPFIAQTEEVTSLTPKWTTGDCKVEIGALLELPTEITLTDIDNIFHDPIATISYTFKQADIEAGTVTLNKPGSVNSLTLKLARVP